MTKAMTPEQVAERWECSEATVRRMLREGRLRGFRVGGKLWRVKPEAVEEFERCQNGDSPSTEGSGAPTPATKQDSLSAARLARMTVR